MKSAIAVLVCGLVLITVAAGNRRGKPEREPRPHTLPPPANALPASVAATPETPEEDAVQENLFEGLGILLEEQTTLGPARYGTTLLGATAEYLGLIGREAEQFREVSQSSAREIEQSWRNREATILALPEWLPGEERDRLEQEAQERYAESKRRTLARLEQFLGSTPRRSRLAIRLEEWIDYLVAR
jgi:hypothetical protein